VIRLRRIRLASWVTTRPAAKRIIEQWYAGELSS